MSIQLQAYASYLPSWRVAGVSRGSRVAAAFDEDSTTMATEAAGALLRSVGTAASVPTLHFATTSPAYLDKTNATAIHAALGLEPWAFAADVAGSARSGVAALRAAAMEAGLAVLADVRTGRPGSADEKLGGDGAAAFLFSTGPGIADLVSRRSLSAEFLDRWRRPLSETGEQWEERFGFEEYAALVRAAVAGALEDAELNSADHVVLTSPNSAVAKRAGSLVKGAMSTTGSPIGHAGAADVGLGLAAVLDIAGPGETILLVSAADGCDALLLRTTDLLVERRQAAPVAVQLASSREVDHLTYLSWRGLLQRELPRRPEPDRPAGPPSARGGAWKFGFNGSRCRSCEMVHLPPQRVCRGCGTQDEMAVVPGTSLVGTVATYTVDRLAFSPSPPVLVVVVDFDGGGRASLELADADPDALAVGDRVELTFRRFFTAGNVHNYFWKARSLLVSVAEGIK